MSNKLLESSGWWLPSIYLSIYVYVYTNLCLCMCSLFIVCMIDDSRFLCSEMAGFIMLNFLSRFNKLESEIRIMVAKLREILNSREAVSNTRLETP